jgi:hypothetical protein
MGLAGPPSVSKSPMTESVFSLEIARTLFTEPVLAQRLEQEELVVERFMSWLASVGEADLLSRAALIDRNLVCRLSGPSMCKIAVAIEKKHSPAIQFMPTLNGHMAHITRAHTMAQVFMPASMAMLVQALEEEERR